LVLGHSDKYVDLEMLPLLAFGECPNGCSGLTDVRVDMAERPD